MTEIKHSDHSVNQVTEIKHSVSSHHMTEIKHSHDSVHQMTVGRCYDCDDNDDDKVIDSDTDEYVDSDKTTKSSLR